MKVKKFRNLIETNYEDLFDEESVLKHIVENFEFKSPTSTVAFIIKFWALLVFIPIIIAIIFISMFFTTLIFPLLIAFIVFIFITFCISSIVLTIFHRLKKQINYEIKRSLNVSKIYKIILDKVENIDIFEHNYKDLEMFVWNYSNVVSTTVKMNTNARSTSYSRPRNELLFKKSDVLHGEFNQKPFSIGIATWRYEVYDSKNKRTDYYYVDSCVLKIDKHASKSDSPLFVNDKHSGPKELDDLENRDFNKKHKIRTADRIFSRKIFTIYTQELWLKLEKMSGLNTKVAIFNDEYVQVFNGKNINQNLFKINPRKIKTYSKEAIAKSILEDIKEDLKYLLLLLSYFGTSEEMNK
ncbi:hypothetical protein [[Mycoplasma] mobile]|uniref:Expressed protein n=1 Tax=Mycoplasma mobile (strain ATCC 43663 / 163K / NCTC 11711) TaxID=267748 RepID=Q6KH69_MYCM1|nr:hypothetical protein [[Mycoplasma] mobile]AAT28061.1 expressed protein [Mycoplasma mobile 163K]